jgi:2-amino-4-hydroxy-6-hydroxymethyldihydropteridine diphosphokinase/dihydropteroate synthase
LRLALHNLKQVPGVSVKQVSPIYMSDAMLTENAPPEWNQPFLNAAIACETHLTPQELLRILKKIETSLGRDPLHTRWSPRVIDLDILAWHDEKTFSDGLTIPHPHLPDRPFALWPLADLQPLWQHPLLQKNAEQLTENWISRFDGNAPFHTRQIQHRIDTPALVGIINVTPDSFSDGGKFSSADAALQQAELLIKAGAEILDIGAESTAPNTQQVDVNLEWQRLEPALSAIMQAKNSFFIPATVSVDTRHAEVARLALAMKIDWLNDVTGFSDPAMRAALRDSEADGVLMHHLTIPPSRDHYLPRDQNPADFLYQWAEQQIALLENEGIARQRLIIDPGFGFGKSVGQALSLLQNMPRFHDLGLRVLVGHSRKIFLKTFTDVTPIERDTETAVISGWLAKQPIDYLRVHNVDMSARVFKVQAVLNA